MSSRHADLTGVNPLPLRDIIVGRGSIGKDVLIGLMTGATRSVTRILIASPRTSAVPSGENLPTILLPYSLGVTLALCRLRPRVMA